MKLIYGVLLSCLVTINCYGVKMPSEMGTLSSKDLSVYPITDSFAGTNATLATAQAGKSNFCVINGGTAAIIGGTTDSACSAATEQFVVLPSNGERCIENVKVRQKICIKSVSTGLGSGTIYGITW